MLWGLMRRAFTLLFIPSSPVSFCGAPGSLRLRSSCRCLRRAPPSTNHLQKHQLLKPCKSLSTHRPASYRRSWSSLPGKSLSLAVSRVLFIVLCLILRDQPVYQLGCAPLELVPVVAALFKIESKKVRIQMFKLISRERKLAGLASDGETRTKVEVGARRERYLSPWLSWQRPR